MCNSFYYPLQTLRSGVVLIMSEIQDEQHELENALVRRQQDAQQVEASVGNLPPVYLKVCRIRDLVPGSHIKWIRPAGFDHHAIVTAVSEVTGEVSVVQFGPTCGCGRGGCCNPNQNCQRCCMIFEATLHLFHNDGSVKGCNLFRADYQGANMSPGEVIARAQELLTEENQRSYNPLSNNCEHIARYCIAGQAISTQAQKFCACFVRYFVLGILKIVIRIVAYFLTFVAIEVKYVAGWVLSGAVVLAHVILFLIFTNPLSCQTMKCCDYRCKYFFILTVPVIVQCMFLALGCVAEYFIELNPLDAVIGWGISVVGTYLALQVGNAFEICCSTKVEDVITTNDQAVLVT